MSASPVHLIAIVEDDVAVLQSLEFDLEAQGYAVRAFSTAQSALDSPELKTACCLILDYALPDLDGGALLMALRARGVDCPALFIASTPSRRCREAAALAHAPLLEKPLMGDVLERQVRELIDGA